MTNGLKDKVALITGAANGIGRSIATLLAEQGAKVIVVDINGLAGEETVNLIQQNGGTAFYINANVSKEDDCRQMIAVTEKMFGRLDILINNAGIMHYQDGNITTLEEKAWDLTMAVNVKSVFLCCKHAIPMLIRNGGIIVNVSSFVALQGSATANMAYSASKAAVIALTRDLAARYAKKNVRVNVLCPGPTLTESFERYISNNYDTENSYLNKIPLGHFANMNEIAKAALFLASDNSSYMTGSTLVVDGGITAIYST
jgi:NAD(P)-dependent dehydrogenase (short-subunit alcohol dehydrogenase family)